MPAPQFTGRYASIRKDVWKGTLGKKFDPKGDNYAGRTPYKTERGYYTAQKKIFDERMAIIDRIEATTVPTHATLTLTHGPRGTYGVQWVADIRYSYGKDGRYGNWIQGDRTTGTGYDKLSTAFADAMDKSPEFLKILMDARAKGKTLPYGVSLLKGTPYLPHYSDGVGMSSLNAVLKASGYEVRELPGNDDIYVYEYTLKRRRA